MRRPRELPGRRPALHDPRVVGESQRPHLRVPALGLAGAARRASRTKSDVAVCRTIAQAPGSAAPCTPETRRSSDAAANLPTETLTMKLPIYLDYSATTPVDPRVAQKMIPYLTESIRQPGVALARVRLGSGEGSRGGARARRGARQLRPEGARLDVRRDRVDQSRAEGRRALLPGQGQAPRHRHDRAQGDARHDARAGARGLRGHLPRRAAERACSISAHSRPRCGRTRSSSR